MISLPNKKYNIIIINNNDKENNIIIKKFKFIKTNN